MSNIQKVTNEIKVPNKDWEILHKHFPHCFDKNGYFLIEKFQDTLAVKQINYTKESYTLDWLGKGYARLLASEPTTHLLQENDDHNTLNHHKDSENLLLKGDNLEILKHLSQAYYEKIKVIYIDPPYNTGNDGFVYSDNRKWTSVELQNVLGIDEENAQRILSFTKSKSNSHSAWLTFMYPRLYIAKQLLKDDGVIFISIDDNEVSQLRLMMDEIFGEENFVGQIIWQTATDNNPTQVATEHEYVLAFAKNKIYQDYWEIPSEKGQIIKAKYEELKNILGNDATKIQNQLRQWLRKPNKDVDLSGVAHYSYVDDVGVYYPGNSANTKPGGYTYDILHPITHKICSKPEYGYRFTYQTFKEAADRGDVQWGADENTIPKIKKRLDTVTQKLKSIYYEDNRATTADLKKLFGGKKVFNNPKSVHFLKYILKFVSKDNDIILDFFAGSGTTGEAVMTLNTEDYAHRKFILVQIPEVINVKENKVAYDFITSELKKESNIFEITKERLLRAIDKINRSVVSKIQDKEKDLIHLTDKVDTEHFQYLTFEIESLKNQDLGFKIFEATPIWEGYLFEADEFDPSQSLFDAEKLTIKNIKSLLTTWKTYDGMLLTHDLEAIDLDGYASFYGNEKLYLMFKGFTTEVLKALLNKIDTNEHFNPTSIIAFGYHFDSRHLQELNDNLKSYTNDKGIDIDFITRY